LSSSAIEYVPHGYAERAAADLVRDPFHGLFEDPGLGKTAQTLMAFDELQSCLDVQSALIIAPLRVCYSVWPREVAKWKQFEHLKVVNLHAGERERGDLYVCNPEHLKKLFGQPHPDPKKKRKWVPGYWKDWTNRPDMLVIDESSLFKRSTGVRFKTLGRYFGDFGRRQILTGSPAPNGYLDLHGQMKVLDGGRSIEQGAALDPRVTYYRAKYFTEYSTGPRAGQVGYNLNPGAGERILEAIAPRITCLVGEDWLELPEVVKTNIPVRIPDRAVEAYNVMRDEALCDLPDGSLLLAHEEATRTKLRQICNGFVYDDDGKIHRLHNVKVDALEERLDEIGDEPVIIAYEFKADFEAISKRIKKFSHFGSGVSGPDGDRIVDQWNAGKILRLLVQPGSMSHGLNLQECGYRIIWFNMIDDFEKYDQLNRRLVRQGQRAGRVFVDHIVAERTLEIQVGRTLQKKGVTEADLKAALAEEVEL
jgi:hypothetical protein